MNREHKLGIVRGISYGLFGPADPFVPRTRALGARLLRVYFFWSQLEPRPGAYRWDAVDALLDQLDGDGDEDIWITLCSSSPWATRTATDFLPASPAHNLAAYAELVRQLVRHCGGRVRYWQCDNEPSNSLLWSATADEYVAQLKVMHQAVKSVDSEALVVLGGCGYDVLSSPLESEERQFFMRLADAGREAFDLFDVHLYGDPYKIPMYIETARQLMRAHGYSKPIVVGEYGGPSLFEFPEVEAALQEALAQAFASPPPTQDTATLAEQTTRDTPERLAMKALYARMTELPPRLQMFMEGCPPALDAKRHRIAARQLVVRNILALADGVDRTLYWSLAPEVPQAVDPYMLMHLLVSKLPMLSYRNGVLDVVHPEANTFALLARKLQRAEHSQRVEDRSHRNPASVHVFRITRSDRAPLHVVWDQRDPFDGECQPPLPVTLDWSASGACAVDAFGEPQPVEVKERALQLTLSDTPMFIDER